MENNQPENTANKLIAPALLIGCSVLILPFILMLSFFLIRYPRGLYGFSLPVLLIPGVMFLGGIIWFIARSKKK